MVANERLQLAGTGPGRRAEVDPDRPGECRCDIRGTRDGQLEAHDPRPSAERVHERCPCVARLVAPLGAAQLVLDGDDPVGLLWVENDATGRLLLAEKHRLALSPDGHGGMLAAFHRSGAMADVVHPLG